MKCKPYCKRLDKDWICLKCGLDIGKEIAKGIRWNVDNSPEEVERRIKILTKK